MMLNKNDLVEYLQGANGDKFKSYIEKLQKNEKMGSEDLDDILQNELWAYEMILFKNKKIPTLYLNESKA